MITRIKNLVIVILALITFAVAGAQIVGSYETWECTCSHVECEWCVDDWTAFHADAVEEYADEFTALFNSYETRWSKNGRLMIRQGDSGSFKFCKKG